MRFADTILRSLSSEHEFKQAFSQHVNDMRVARLPYREARATCDGMLYVFDTAYPSEADWINGLFALDILEARWPLAAIEGVRVRPVPDSIVRDR